MIDPVDMVVRSIDNLDHDIRNLRDEIKDLRKELTGLQAFKWKIIGMTTGLSIILPLVITLWLNK